MSALNNKEIVKLCPNYYKIINSEFLDSEQVSKKLIQIFQEYIFSINPNNINQVNIIKKLDECLVKYFEDGELKKELIQTISTLKIKTDVDNIMEFIVKKIIESYDKYCEHYTRNLYIPRWI